jgi:hypothetical protein
VHIAIEPFLKPEPELISAQICTNLQGVFFPNSGLLADQGVAGKGVPIGGIDGLSSGTYTSSRTSSHSIDKFGDISCFAD